MNERDFVELCCRTAGRTIMKSFRSPSVFWSEKGKSDLVSSVDKSVEHSIRSLIRKHFPEDAILGEEFGRHGNSERVWVIDPLDGTTNFFFGIPIFGFSICLKNGGIVEKSGISIPTTGDFFYAENGKGAFLNGDKIQVSNSDPENSMVAFCYPDSIGGEELVFSILRSLSSRYLRAYKLGSAAFEFAYTALGKLSGYASIGLKEWDFLSGKLLVEEAGGVFKSFEKNGLSFITCGPSDFVDFFCGLV